jgi:hypothetical protein
MCFDKKNHRYVYNLTLSMRKLTSGAHNMRANDIEMRTAFCQKNCQMTAMMETVVKQTEIT